VLSSPAPAAIVAPALVKLPERMSADERRAAAAAAREWEADRLRTQSLLSRLADRAEAAELALAEARAADCANNGSSGASGSGGGSAPRGSLSGARASAGGSPRRAAAWAGARASAAGGAADAVGSAADAAERAALLDVELGAARERLQLAEVEINRLAGQLEVRWAVGRGAQAASAGARGQRPWTACAGAAPRCLHPCLPAPLQNPSAQHGDLGVHCNPPPPPQVAEARTAGALNRLAEAERAGHARADAAIRERSEVGKKVFNCTK
jgi:hypothetical protein